MPVFMTNPGAKTLHPSSRKVESGREKIVNAAALLFNDKGYDRTSMREIAASANMKAGSLYYYFDSKEELLLAVEVEAFRRVTEQVEAALEGVNDEWERLIAACSAHLSAVLENREYIKVTSTELPQTRSKTRQRRFAALRNEYENIFRGLVDDLPLENHIDRSLFRLSILGAMAWTLVWYREDGKYQPSVIARKIIGMLRQSTEDIN